MSEQLLSDAELDTIRVVTNVSCSLSLLGALVVFVSFAFLQRQKPLRLLILALSICDGLNAIAYMIPNDDDKLCDLQAFLTMYFSMASFLFTDAIGLILALTVVKNGVNWAWHMRKFNTVVFTISIGLPLILVTLVGLFNKEGRDPGFGWDECWISHHHSAWRLVGGKFVEWFSWIFVIICYTVTIYSITKLRSQGTAAKSSIHRRLVFIPVVFIALRLPSAIRTIHDWINGPRPLYWLAIFQAIGDPGQGFVNGLCFALFKKEVRRSFCAYFHRRNWLLCCCEPREVDSYLLNSGTNHDYDTNTDEYTYTYNYDTEHAGIRASDARKPQVIENYNRKTSKQSRAGLYGEADISSKSSQRQVQQEQQEQQQPVLGHYSTRGIFGSRSDSRSTSYASSSSSSRDTSPARHDGPKLSPMIGGASTGKPHRSRSEQITSKSKANKYLNAQVGPNIVVETGPDAIDKTSTDPCISDNLDMNLEQRRLRFLSEDGTIDHSMARSIEPPDSQLVLEEKQQHNSNRK